MDPRHDSANRPPDPTTDPSVRSFVPLDPAGDFPIQNLPFGVFRPRSGGPARVGVAIGAMVLDLSVLERRGVFRGAAFKEGPVFDRGSLNAFLALGRPAWREARAAIHRLLREDGEAQTEAEVPAPRGGRTHGEPVAPGAPATSLRADEPLRREALLPAADVTMELPVEIGDYTDFYSSREHATNVGAMFRGRENALLPNWLHVPIAYHGRASSIVVSGTEVRRPQGQTRPDAAAPPVFGPSRRLDIELEAGFFIGPGNRLGEPIPVAEAEERVFGLVLVNDWSARDIQTWEYQPLGPFLAKNFATTISPWVVPLDALEPFRCAGPVQDPAPLPYLRTFGDRAFDIRLEVGLQTAAMNAPHPIARSNFRHLYWSVAQQLAHHASGGCNLRPGDLLASGTISGPTPDSYGSLLELTWNGQQPISLPNGETRRFLEDGDTVVLRGWCEGNGRRIGFGEARGRILPAIG